VKEKGRRGVVFHRRRRWHDGGGRTEVAALRASGAPSV
jgi:hypothetical protein